MKQYLFLFTIGPVQSFISQARKTQDLYAGSFLLSNLCKTAAAKFTDDYGGKLIFPSDLSAQSVPNRFIGEIEADSDKLSEIGKSVENAVREEIENIGQKIKACFHCDSERFDRQISSLLDIYWVFYLYQNYNESYLQIERLLGAIKNVRQFDQLNNGNGETGRKCSICGQRNALFYRKNQNNNVPAFLDDGAKIFAYDRKDLKRIIAPGEGLCGVCFVKRNLRQYYSNRFDDKFPSTSDIVLAPATKELSEKQIDDKELSDILVERRFDSQGVMTLKDGRDLTEEEYDYIEETQKLYKVLEKHKISDYYALIMLDGDNMGKWLSGEFLKEKDKSRLKEFHKLLSKGLTDFGNKAKNKIEQMSGCAVYAGGDDFMGLVSLKHSLNLIEELREYFKSQINDEIHKEFPIENELTFSAGIAISHYKYPLSEAVKWARKAEHDAKEDGGRNAFAIAVLKHSGEIRETVSCWSYESKEEDHKTVDLLKELVSDLNNDASGFSNAFIKNIETEFDGFTKISGTMIETELKRLLMHSSKLTGEKKYTKAKIMSEKLANLFTDLQTDKLGRNFFYFLNIADFIARGIK